MTYEQHKDLKPEEFKRLCGVHTETFNRMDSVIQEQVEQKKRKPGKPSFLSVENQVLLDLGEIKMRSPIQGDPLKEAINILVSFLVSSRCVKAN